MICVHSLKYISFGSAMLCLVEEQLRGQHWLLPRNTWRTRWSCWTSFSLYISVYLLKKNTCATLTTDLNSCRAVRAFGSKWSLHSWQSLRPVAALHSWRSNWSLKWIKVNFMQQLYLKYNHTKSPLSPRGPFGPLSPFSPFSPWSPIGPTCIKNLEKVHRQVNFPPFNPISPRWPLIPLLPLSPFGPLGPSSPFLPVCPVSPDIAM